MDIDDLLCSIILNFPSYKIFYPKDEFFGKKLSFIEKGKTVGTYEIIDLGKNASNLTCSLSVMVAEIFMKYDKKLNFLKNNYNFELVLMNNKEKIYDIVEKDTPIIAKISGSYKLINSVDKDLSIYDFRKLITKLISKKKKIEFFHYNKIIKNINIRSILSLRFVEYYSNMLFNFHIKKFDIKIYYASVIIVPGIIDLEKDIEPIKKYKVKILEDIYFHYLTCRALKIEKHSPYLFFKAKKMLPDKNLDSLSYEELYLNLTPEYKNNSLNLNDMISKLLEYTEDYDKFIKYNNFFTDIWIKMLWLLQSNPDDKILIKLTDNIRGILNEPFDKRDFSYLLIILCFSHFKNEATQEIWELFFIIFKQSTLEGVIDSTCLTTYVLLALHYYFTNKEKIES